MLVMVVTNLLMLSALSDKPEMLVVIPPIFELSSDMESAIDVNDEEDRSNSWLISLTD